MNGFYRIAFTTGGQVGFGVAVARDGEFHGGGSSMFYAGTYRVEGDTFAATIRSGIHTVLPGVKSVTGRDDVVFRVVAQVTGQGVKGTATPVDDPATVLQFLMEPIPDAGPAPDPSREAG